MSDKHWLWKQPPPTWYEGFPTRMLIAPTLEFSFSTPARDPIVKFTDLSPGMLIEAESGLTNVFTYEIP